jgi:glycosyltransferase involved in cell wall biosynthesis
MSNVNLINTSLVTIGIPTYNRPEGLARTLKCITEQTYKNIEIIVSDNCSTNDETDLIVQKFQQNDCRIKYVKQPFNIGPAANFDFLKNNAAGKYFAWAADDDFCSLHFVEALVKELELDPELVLVTPDVITVGSDGKEICTSELIGIRIGAPWIKARRQFFEYPISNIFFAIYGLYRLDALRQVSAESALGCDGLATNSEVPFLAKLSLLGRIASIPRNLKFYYSHSDSVFYDEQRKIKPWQRVRLALSIRVKLVQIVLRANLSMCSRFELMFTVIKSAIKHWWSYYLILNIRKVFGRIRARLSSHYRRFKFK